MPTTVIDVRVSPECSGLYCPVCGLPIWKVREDPPKCKHIFFLGSDMLQEFSYTAPACQRIADEAQEAVDEYDTEDLVRYVLDHLDPITAGRILCFSCTADIGWESVTQWIAIDFDPDAGNGADGDEHGAGRGEDEFSADSTEE